METNKEYKIDFYKIMSSFFICGFLGWIFETVAVFIETGKITKRGYLFIGKNLSYYFPILTNFSIIGSLRLVWGLPIIEIYGLGGQIIYILIIKYNWRGFKLFFYGMSLMTLFELLGSYFCTYALRLTLWDYSNDILNFHGRVCLRASLAWGFLCLFTKSVIAPIVDRFYEKRSNRKNFHLVLIILIIYTIICGKIKY